MAEVALWQYRWTNPANEPHHPPSMLEWKNVEHPRWQPLESKLQELRSYTFDGKPCYEVRALGVITDGVEIPPAPLEITPEMMNEAAKRVGFDPVPGRLTRLAGVLNAMLAHGVPGTFDGRNGNGYQPLPKPGPVAPPPRDPNGVAVPADPQAILARIAELDAEKARLWSDYMLIEEAKEDAAMSPHGDGVNYTRAEGGEDGASRLRFDVLQEIAHTFGLDYNAVCRCANAYLAGVGEVPRG